MRLTCALLVVTLLAGCATMNRMQRDYEDANSALSPNFDQNKIYTLAILPPSGLQTASAANQGGLYDFAGMSMIQTGHFSLVERSRIDALLKEQEFGASGVVDPSTAARLGKVLGADAVMLISIAYTRHDDFFTDSPEQRETELYVKVISSSTAEVLYYGRGQATSMASELEAWQSAFSVAIGKLKRKGGM